VTVGRLLSVAGMSRPGVLDQKRLSIDDSVRALTGGRIDAFFFSGGLPVAGIKQLGAQTPIRIVDLSTWADPLRRSYSDVYVVRDVPTSIYHAPAVSTVAVPNLLAVPASMADDLAYDLTRLLIERRDLLAAAHPAAEELDIRSAIATQPVPLHPGAARYYRSVKP
jgi:TRAP transporter TAXI family solute receptor